MRVRKPLPLVVTVEHASCALPAACRGLGVRAARLRSHQGWDPGARLVGVHVARALAAPVFLGRWSRLFVDLNRSATHPRVVPRVAHGEPVPGNRDLDAAARRGRIERYWQPWRDAVERRLAAMVARRGGVLHVSVHSFVGELDGEVRNADFGMLYDPRRARERALVEQLQTSLVASGHRVRRNYPYAGRSDGFTSHLRRLYPDRVYAGIEIEMNQDSVGRPARARRWAEDIVEALRPLVAAGGMP
ncbi:MAG: N-formylglutamate amidohydrolase [Planctomycetota bacterium]